MELSKLQTIALVVLTTILTDKYLINHSYNNYPKETVNQTQIGVSPTPIIAGTTPSIQLSPTVSNTQNEIILKEIQNLRKEMTASINDIKNKTNASEPMPTLAQTSPLIGGMVKVASSQWKKIDVHEKALSSSKIIGTIVYDTIYFYRTKQNDWYQVDIDNGQLGWVQSQFLNEFP